MYIEHVEIENFKPLEHMEIDFAPGVNLILGNNGVAKTTILEALTVALGDFLNGVPGTEKKGIAERDIRVQKKLVGDASTAKNYALPVRIASSMNLDGSPASGEVSRADAAASRTKWAGKEITRYAKELSNNPEAELPLLVYYSTKRLLAPRTVDFRPGKNKLDDRRCGYLGCLSDDLDTRALKAWCMKMEMAAFRENRKVTEYEAFKKTIAAFMTIMNDLEEEPVIEYSRTFEDIVYTENGEELPINYLSAGYQSLLWMIMDIAFRLAQLNPGMADQSLAKGMILIDEIDMHLHPKWQWKVLEAFGKTFPDMQIITTTHAPIVISSCREGKLIYINEQRQVEYPESAYAYSIQDIVELTQGSFSIPKQLQDEYQQFEQAFACREKEKAESILRNLTLEYGEDNSQVRKANRKMTMRKGW